ncbi:hypothetical protein NO995_07055 [Aestuariibaculum sp. M13]|uniref:hypothetical protein n=1 Tax=Aestuariibaculum sp. M13 TaxID=2967132 RepID=UPI002159DDBD|nr:hypothetical protein [Aestuariibaculum sp. M13]MCR8667432.1 hypothetical protein [Aestuariibaculum sp. M13]
MNEYDWFKIIRYLINIILVIFIILLFADYSEKIGSVPQYIDKNTPSLSSLEFKQQLKFREEIISEFESNFKQSDSISPLPFDYQLMNYEKIDNSKEHQIDISTIEDIPTSFIFKYSSIKYLLTIDEFKLNEIKKRVKNKKEFIEQLKYSDYININKTINKEFRLNKFLIILISWIIINLILYILPLIFIKTNNDLTVSSEEKEKINNEKKELEENLKKDKNDSIESSELKKLQAKVNKLIIKDELESFMKLNIDNIEKLTTETKNRANFMLISGILMSFTAVIFFYINLPDYDFKKNDYTSFLIKGIRPLTILIFIESISWFLLKQYRKIISDYKYFYRIYQEKLKILELYKLTKEEKNLDIDKLFDHISEQEFNISVSSDKDKSLIDHKEQFSILKEVINKINLP